MPESLTFEQWSDELKTLMVREYGFTFSAANSTDLTEMKGYYESGYTPNDALQEDFSDAGD